MTIRIGKNTLSFTLLDVTSQEQPVIYEPYIVKGGISMAANPREALKTVNLSYRLPIPGSWDWLQGVTVWAEAQNLLTVTRYLGNDPEFSAANAVLYQGIDCGNLAMGRSITLGMKINL